jgi:hypothetical protein
MASGFTLTNFIMILVGAVFIWAGVMGFQEQIVDRRPLSWLGNHYGDRCLAYLIGFGVFIIISQFIKF